MTAKKSPEALLNFLSFAYDDDDVDYKELRDDLCQEGVKIENIMANLQAKISSAEISLKKSWMTTAKKRQAAIEEKLQLTIQKLRDKFGGVREMAAAIRDGKLGGDLQTHASAFFRNQDLDQISEEDLISFFEDFELLEKLDGDGDEN